MSIALKIINILQRIEFTLISKFYGFAFDIIDAAADNFVRFGLSHIYRINILAASECVTWVECHGGELRGVSFEAI